MGADEVFTEENWRRAVKIMKRQERERTDGLIASAKKGPLSDDEISEVARLGIREASHFLRHHPGYKLDAKIKSLWNMLDVFRCACQGIQEGISRFAELVATDRFGHREMRPKAEKVKNEIRKEIFATSSAAFALVDISRRVFKVVEVPGVTDRIERDFAKSGDHHLISGLRNDMSHSWFAPAGWQVSYSFGGQSVTTFKFNCSELLCHGDYNKIAKQYIQAAGESIDVGQLFDSYSFKVDKLYSWLGEVLEDYIPQSVHECRRCLQEQKTHANRCFWNLVLTQVAIPKKINPYDKLDRFLTKEELAEVHALPHRSKEQVDRIIELVDEFGACDDELRAKVYKLFGVAMASSK